MSKFDNLELFVLTDSYIDKFGMNHFSYWKSRSQKLIVFSPLLPSRKTITKLEKLFYLNSYLHINFINAINIHNQQFPIFLIDNYLINKKILFIENGSNNVETNLLLSVYLKVSDF